MKRIQLKARTRLTAAYLCLFVVLGVVLVAVNYQLLASKLPAGSASTSVSGMFSASNATVGPVTAPTVGAGPPHSVSAIASVIDNYRSDALHSLVTTSVLGLVITAAVAGILVWLVARRALRPLHAMNTTATRITEHSLNERLPVAGPQDELSELGATFNAVLDRLEGAFAHERRLVANASHELNTPLANQRALLEVTLDDPTASREQLLDACRTALDQNLRSQRLLSGMLTLARAEHAELARVPVRLDRVIQEAVDGRERVDCVVAECTVEGEPLLVERIVANLVDNAAQHGLDSDRVSIHLRVEKGFADLTVSNRCLALPEGSEEALLEPFRRGTTDRTNSSSRSGLGLAIVAAAAASHGWDFRLDLSQSGLFRAILRVPLPDNT